MNFKPICRPLAAIVLCFELAPAEARAQDAQPPKAEGEPATAPPAPASTQAPPAPTPPPAAPAADDAALERELARELGEIQSAQQPGSAAGAAPKPEPAPAQSAASARGLSNAQNPAISANGVVIAGGSSREDARVVGIAATDEFGDLRNGIHLQEVELLASAIVDPYFRADVNLASDGEEIGFEEAYLSTLELPSVTIRAGQMRAAFGRHNPLHTHAFPFLIAPLPLRALLGPEGLAGPGVSFDVLLPLPFFAEVNAQAFSGEWLPFEGSVADDPDTAADEAQPDQRHAEDLEYLGHLKTLFDLSDSTTLELGATYVGGRNGFGAATNVIGGDMTLKWRPIESERYRAIEWTTEYLWEDRGGEPAEGLAEPPELGSSGGYTSLRFLFAQRFWVQARAAMLGTPDELPAARVVRAEALLAFVPSEFSALRLQYALESERGESPPIHELYLQAIFAIGPHPAHAY